MRAPVTSRAPASIRLTWSNENVLSRLTTTLFSSEIASMTTRQPSAVSCASGARTRAATRTQSLLAPAPPPPPPSPAAAAAELPDLRRRTVRRENARKSARASEERCAHMLGLFKSSTAQGHVIHLRSCDSQKRWTGDKSLTR